MLIILMPFQDCIYIVYIHHTLIASITIHVCFKHTMVVVTFSNIGIIVCSGLNSQSTQKNNVYVVFICYYCIILLFAF